jgi:hypothetical protein
VIAFFVDYVPCGIPALKGRVERPSVEELFEVLDDVHESAKDYDFDARLNPNRDTGALERQAARHVLFERDLNLVSWSVLVRTVQGMLDDPVFADDLAIYFEYALKRAAKGNRHSGGSVRNAIAEKYGCDVSTVTAIYKREARIIARLALSGIYED